MIATPLSLSGGLHTVDADAYQIYRHWCIALGCEPAPQMVFDTLRTALISTADM